MEIHIKEHQEAVAEDLKIVTINIPRPDLVEETNLKNMRTRLAEMDSEIAVKTAQRNTFAAKIASVEEIIES